MGFLRYHYRRFRNDWHNSLDGFKAVWRERSFRIETVAAIILVPAGLYLGESGVEKALLSGAVALVLLSEVGNTAWEKTVDRISTADDNRSKQIKDIGSLYVGATILLGLSVWALVLFIP